MCTPSKTRHAGADSQSAASAVTPAQRRLAAPRGRVKLRGHISLKTRRVHVSNNSPGSNASATQGH